MRAALVLLVALSACSNASSQAISGTVQNGFYTNPDQTFRIKVPPLLRPGVSIRDRSPLPQGWQVEFIDDLCRNYVVTERVIDLGGETLQDWVARDVVPRLENAGAEDISVRAIHEDGRLTPAILVRYKHPERAPCMVYRSADGQINLTQPGGYPPDVEAQLSAQGYSITRPTADVGQYIFTANDRAYRLIYVIGENMLGQEAFLKVGPVDELLGGFVDGFELLASSP